MATRKRAVDAEIVRALAEAEYLIQFAREMLHKAPATRALQHIWFDPVRRWLNSHSAQRVTSIDVLCRGLGIQERKITVAAQQDIGRIMLALGWQRQRAGEGYPREWYYVRPAKSAQQSNADVWRTL